MTSSASTKTLAEPVPGDALAALRGASPAMAALRARVLRILPTDVTVLIEGETGTGKELLARALHAGGPRRGRPFVAVNCGALAHDLAESELFGHERGAFTGALARRAGRAAEADGGTLFLDEIGELPPSLQCALLRLLQEGEVQRIGSDRPLAVDVRIVAATNRDLATLVTAGRFRADCFYRLAACIVRMPPLRERTGDVGLLAHGMLARFAVELGRLPLVLRPEAEALLARHGWPGNVRELENVVRALVLFADTCAVDADDVRTALAGREVVDAPVPADLATLLARYDGNVTRTADALGVSRPTLYKRLRAAAFDLRDYRGVRKRMTVSTGDGARLAAVRRVE